MMRSFFYQVSVLAVTFFFANGAFAQAETTISKSTSDLAYGAYQRGEYKLAMKEALERLESNRTDAASMTLLGELYAQGLGVLPDQKKAAEWYTAAAKSGDRNAMAALGLFSMEGRGVKQDTAAGRAWFEKAAEMGEPIASFNLALILLNSPEKADVDKAINLLTFAAEAEVIDAQQALAIAYLKGRGVEQSDTKAGLWFKRAIENGHTPSEVEYAILLFYGRGIEKDEILATKLFLRAAMKGNAVAQNRLARLFVVGRGVPKDLAEAAAWHQMASIQGLPDPWLDKELLHLSKDEAEKAERLVKERALLQ